MIHALLGLALISAVLDWIAVWKKNKKLEGVVKPLTMVLLILWIILFGQQQEMLDSNLKFFLVGLVFCLIGDVFLFLPPQKFFVFGLVAFLLGHVGYIIGLGGFNEIFDYVIPYLTYIGILVVLGYRIVGILIKGLQKNNRENLKIPVIVYSLVISIMLASAGYRFFDSKWTPAGAALISGGALLFYVSDVLNAWERFVNKFNNDRLIIMVSYHLGQFGLAIGAAFHFAGNFPG